MASKKKALPRDSKARVMSRELKMCEECFANPAKYEFINGDEKINLCEPSLQDTLVDLVTNNDTITFHTGDKKPGKLQTIEVL